MRDRWPTARPGDAVGIAASLLVGIALAFATYQAGRLVANRIGQRAPRAPSRAPGPR